VGLVLVIPAFEPESQDDRLHHHRQVGPSLLPTNSPEQLVLRHDIATGSTSASRQRRDYPNHRLCIGPLEAITLAGLLFATPT
jgi:hypothetical protein